MICYRCMQGDLLPGEHKGQPLEISLVVYDDDDGGGGVTGFPVTMRVCSSCGLVSLELTDDQMHGGYNIDTGDAS